MKNLIEKIFKPVIQTSMVGDLFLTFPRMICGYLLAFDFGASKFGMPWTPEASELSLFEVSGWFVDDVALFGGPFAAFPLWFAWLGAASEAIGGLFLAIGLKTRAAALMIMSTMFVAIFFQKWEDGVWGMLPAMGFLWVAIQCLVLGSGRFGLDYFIYKKLENRRFKVAPLSNLKNKPKTP